MNRSAKIPDGLEEILLITVYSITLAGTILAMVIGLPAALQDLRDMGNRYEERQKQMVIEGAEARAAGVPAEANPYTYTDARKRWLKGWMGNE